MSISAAKITRKQKTYAKRSNLVQPNHSIYSKTCLKRPLEIDKTKVLMKNGSLMKVESIAECSLLERSEILLTCIKR